jgi:hypothetical protein
MAHTLGRHRQILFRRPKRRARVAVSLMLVFAAGVALAVALSPVSHAMN